MSDETGPANRRETGGRTLKRKDGPDAAGEVSRDAAKNRKSPLGIGNAETLDDRNEKTRHYDGQRPAPGKR